MKGAILLFLCTLHWSQALLVSPPPPDSRRSFLTRSTACVTALVATTSILSPSTYAWALDMEAFEKSQLGSSDQQQLSTKKDLSADEGLCRYGAPGKDTGEACVRAGISTKRTGTLDAFGNVDRGDFVRCKTFYEDTGARYEKKVVCE